MKSLMTHPCLMTTPVYDQICWTLTVWPAMTIPHTLTHAQSIIKMSHNKGSSPGVFSLHLASWMISILQLSYNVFCIISIMKTIDSMDTSDHTHTYLAISCSYYIGSAVLYFLQVCAAIILLLGNTL